MSDIKSLSKDELKLISQLLSLASQEFANHGCNDFDLPATKENKKIIAEMIQDNGDTDWEEDVIKVMQAKKQINTYDWWVMSYLASRCEKLSKDDE